MIKTGGPAFPQVNLKGARSGHGMSMRDYFAAKAMQIALTEISNSDSIENHLTLIANTSYIVADAMIEARDKQNET